MEFQKFSSLENSYRDRFTNQCKGLCVKEWVATEKVHGSNFQFAVDAATLEFKVGKRSSFVGTNANGEYDFYGCNEVAQAHKERVIALAHTLVLHGLALPTSVVVVYGELFGDGVQKGIQYGPKDFIAFDIKVDNTWLDWEDVVRYAAQSGIATVPEVATGTLEELLEIDPNFRSKLTPPTHDGENFAEGFVIKQLRNELLLPSGSRACIKVKTEKFKEVGKAKKPKQQLKLTLEQEQLHMSFSTYLTEARLRNVLSKFGQVTKADFGPLLGAFMTDAITEYERDELDGAKLDKDDWKVVKKSLQKVAGSIIGKNMLNIMDGEF